MGVIKVYIVGRTLPSLQNNNKLIISNRKKTTVHKEQMRDCGCFMWALLILCHMNSLRCVLTRELIGRILGFSIISKWEFHTFRMRWN